MRTEIYRSYKFMSQGIIGIIGSDVLAFQKVFSEKKNLIISVFWNSNLYRNKTGLRKGFKNIIFYFSRMGDNIILEISEKLSEDNHPVFYKYRYTFEKTYADDIEKQVTYAKSILKYIKENYCVGERMTAGIEHYSKGMQKAKPHLHIHFMSKTKSDTIRKGLMRRFDMIGRVQSCKAEVLVDEDKFWRYPLKQQKNESLRFITFTGFEKTYIENLRDVAYACWKQSAEVHLAKLEKKEEKTSRDRLYVFLDSQQQDIHSIKEAYILAYKYYVENENQLNISSVNSYVNIWILKNNLITYDDFYEKYHKF